MLVMRGRKLLEKNLLMDKTIHLGRQDSRRRECERNHRRGKEREGVN